MFKSPCSYLSNIEEPTPHEEHSIEELHGQWVVLTSPSIIKNCNYYTHGQNCWYSSVKPHNWHNVRFGPHFGQLMPILPVPAITHLSSLLLHSWSLCVSVTIIFIAVKKRRNGSASNKNFRALLHLQINLSQNTGHNDTEAYVFQATAST